MRIDERGRCDSLHVFQWYGDVKVQLQNKKAKQKSAIDIVQMPKKKEKKEK